MWKRYLLLSFVIAIFVYSPIAVSGTLDDFESSSSSSSGSSGGCGNSYYDDHHHHRQTDPYPTTSTLPAKKSAMDKVVEKYLPDYSSKTLTSVDTQKPKTEIELPVSQCHGGKLACPKMTCLKTLRKAGYNAIPTIRFEGNYQKLTTDIQGYNLNLTIGHGIFGFEIDYIQYFENNPDDTLYFITPRALFRLPSTYYEFDIGIGATLMKGNRQNTGFNFGGAAYLFPMKNLILDSKVYVIGFSEKKSMVDFDFGISYKYKMMGARGGYRMLWTNGNQTLHGPHIGIFVQW